MRITRKLFLSMLFLFVVVLGYSQNKIDPKEMFQFLSIYLYVNMIRSNKIKEEVTKFVDKMRNNCTHIVCF